MSFEDEEVMVVPATALAALNEPRDFTPLGDMEADALTGFLFQTALFKPRDQVEHDPAFKQLIPYVVFTCEARALRGPPTTLVFQYTRTKLQGEVRLHGKHSIGVGGHVRPADVYTKDAKGLANQYWGGLEREISEEVDLSAAKVAGQPFIIAFLYDDSDEVGRVHLGIVHECRCEQAVIWPKEASMSDAAFRPLHQQALAAEHRPELYENWTRLCLRGLAQRKGIT